MHFFSRVDKSDSILVLTTFKLPIFKFHIEKQKFLVTAVFHSLLSWENQTEVSGGVFHHAE
jgi:hypothetical protein